MPKGKRTDVAFRKAKVAEFRSVGYGKKTAWLKKQNFSYSALYRWVKMYSRKRGGARKSA